jgi:sugar lactone lactonase YvrE
MFAANGMRTGADGRLYVAQGVGSQVSAIDIATGQIEVVVPKGGEILDPDDLAFDRHGNMYVTEPQSGRVTVRDLKGHVRVLNGEIPAANGITFYKDRMFIDECRMGGRMMEMDTNTGAIRVFAEDLPMPNALEMGPDGMLYFPLLGTNEIWRINPEGGKPERVVGDLGVPDAVKFDSEGFIISTQFKSGQVLRINPRNGNRTVLAALDPGLDNLNYVGGRLFASHMTDGRVTEILADGKTRAVLPAGFNWPLGVAADEEGNLFIADGKVFYVIPAGGRLQALSRPMGEGVPHGIRGVTAVSGRALIVTTWDGKVIRYRPWEKTYEILVEGLNQIYGLAVGPGGDIVVPEFGTGRVVSVKSGATTELARGLKDPIDAAFTADGTCLISEAEGGRVVKLTRTGVETVVDGLKRPQGILVRNEILYIVDALAQELVAYDLESKVRQVIATDLPVGVPPGVVAKVQPGVPWFCGPLGQFAGITAGANGTLYISADAEGSVIAIRPA